MHQSEEDFLVLSAQQGDRRAIGLLYRHYHQRLLRYACKVCGTPDMAQEAVQEAWIKALKNLNRLEDPRAFRSWLYNLVRWRAIDILRKDTHYCDIQRKQRKDTHYCEDLEETPCETPPLAETATDDSEELHQAINRLPLTERQIIHLFYLDELKVNEIALILNIASGTVKSRLNRARQLLKARFDTN